MPDLEEIEGFDVFGEEEAPLYIALGEILKEKEEYGTRYTFTHIPLADMQTKTFPEGTDPDDEENPTTLSNVEQMMYFRTIGDAMKQNTSKIAAETKIKDENGQPANYDKQDDQKDSGFITPNGTIVPSFITPTDVGLQNLSLGTGEEKQDKEDKSYTWIAVQKKLESEEENGQSKDSGKKLSESETKDYEKAAKELKNYAVEHKVDEKNSYISVTGKHPVLDKEGFEREFICNNFPHDNAFAMLLDFSGHEKIEGQDCKMTLELYDDDSSLEQTGDEITFTALPDGNAKIEINKNGGIEGPLVFSQQGTKPRQGNSDSLKSKNFIYFYTLMNSMIVTGDLTTDPKQSSNCLNCKKSKEFNAASDADHPVNQYPAEHKDGSANNINVENKKAFIQIPRKARMKWTNCWGNFSVTPMKYNPNISFSYYYRLSGEQTQTNDGMSGSDDYFQLEVGRRNGNYNVPTDGIKSKKISYDEETQTSVFRTDVNITAKQTWQSSPTELFGLIHVTKHHGKMADVLAGNGNFQVDFEKNHNKSLYTNYTNNADLCDNEGGWEKFITNVSVSHGSDGTTGTLTLDKYLMMDLGVSPKQVIGALTLVAKNGFYKNESTTMNGESCHINPCKHYDLPWGQFFKGYGMEIQDSVSESASTLNVKLVGIQKKLSDMALVNCPFWDGDPVFEAGRVMDYFISYTGCELKFVDAFSKGSRNEIILPRSWDWHAPAVNFVLGTPCLDALKEIAKKINHQFIIQPDGCGYFYEMDDYGRPIWITKGGIVADFSEDEIISMDISPYLENRFNTFLTLAILGTRNTEDGCIFPAGEKPGLKFSVTHIHDDDFPWSRIHTSAEPGVVTLSELDKFHRANVRFGNADHFQGTITVPGCHAYCLLDKIRIKSRDGSDSITFYITGVNHNLNLQTKEWTSSLSVAKFEL